MRILVIGSEGNVGKPLVRHLRKLGHSVVETDIRPGHRPDFYVADINSPLDLLEAFDHRPEVVVLMAAIVSRVTSEQAASLCLATNLSGLNNVVQLCRRAGARLINFSTSEVYGPQEGLMDEDSTEPRPNNRYGLSKLLGEKIVEYEVRANGLKAVCLRPFMIYGEDEDLGDHRSAMIRFVEGLSAGRPITVHQGTARAWLHIEDAVALIERSMSVEEYHRINIGNPDNCPTEELAERVRVIVGADPALVRLVPQPGGMTPDKRPNLRKQRELLKYEPRISLDEGLRRVCARFLNGRKGGKS